MIPEDQRTLTVLTPTYNRASYLPALFESLEKQTDFDFDWLVVDDGSEDGTADVVRRFQTDRFRIQYVYQTNGGKHTALNAGIARIQTPLTIIVDSDDYLTEDAVEQIKRYYAEWKNEPIAAITFLKGYSKERVVGQPFLREKRLQWLVRDVVNEKIGGDKAEVFVTEKLKEFPFPVCPNEKFMPETTVWMPLLRKYPFVPVNRILYICNYLDEGLTLQGKKMRLRNPRGGILNNEQFLERDVCFSHRLKSAILVTVYAKAAEKGCVDDLVSRVWKKHGLLMALAYLPGLIFYRKWK